MIICLWAIIRALQAQSPATIIAALAATSPVAVFVAAALVALNFGVLSLMEACGLQDAGVRLPVRRIGFSGFVANALSVVIGLGPISGTVVRTRLFRAWGLPSHAAAITALSVTLTSLSGGAVLAGLGLAIQPEWARDLTGAPSAIVRGAAIGYLCLVAAAILWASRRRFRIVRPNFTFSTPSARGVLLRLMLGAFDWLISGHVFYTLMTATVVLAPASFLTLFASAHFMGMAVGAPAGLGVFDAIMLHIRPAAVTPARIAAALLLYRLVANAAPAIIALAFFGTIGADSNTPDSKSAGQIA